MHYTLSVYSAHDLMPYDKSTAALWGSESYVSCMDFLSLKGTVNLISCPQVPRYCRMMSSLRISLGFCSFSVRATTMVGGCFSIHQKEVALSCMFLSNIVLEVWLCELLFFLIVLSVLDFQNFLRTQTGNTTTVNIIISTVDYLLRLQVWYCYREIQKKYISYIHSCSTLC